MHYDLGRIILKGKQYSLSFGMEINCLWHQSHHFSEKHGMTVSWFLSSPYNSFFKVFIHSFILLCSFCFHHLLICFLLICLLLVWFLLVSFCWFVFVDQVFCCFGFCCFGFCCFGFCWLGFLLFCVFLVWFLLIWFLLVTWNQNSLHWQFDNQVTNVDK